MSKIKTWMPLYIGDYLADTASLSTLQHGAYMLLMMEIWRNGPIQNNPRRLSRVAKTDVQTWEDEIWPELQDFFTVVDGCLDQKRLRAEHEKAEEISKKRADAAAKRHASKQNACKTDANAEQMESNSSANAYANAEQVHSKCSASGHANDIQKDTQSQSQSHSSLRSEDVGCNRATEIEKPIADRWQELAEDVIAATGNNPARSMVRADCVRQWLADASARGYSFETATEIILGTVREKSRFGGKGKPPAWFNSPVTQALASGTIPSAHIVGYAPKSRADRVADAWAGVPDIPGV
ncbi:hypothetical protein NBRC3299_0255 [Acetobacter pasteurianus NBRC 3299]|nr:hypothetical protein NBRC3299_0255 [Acetobacter pasteurianus NBRC 3299]